MKALHLAGQEDRTTLLPMVAAFHGEIDVRTDEDTRHAAVLPLLDGCPQGAIWLIGPRRAPVGYVALSFSWSILRGGLQASIIEFYIRPAIRGRGMGVEALWAILKAMRDAGVTDLHVEQPREDAQVTAFFTKRGFAAREGVVAVTRPL